MKTFTGKGIKVSPGTMPRLLSLLTALTAAFLAVTLIVTTGLSQAHAQGTSTATAQLQDDEGNPAGTAEFVETPQGVEVTVNLTGGLKAGLHGIHIHEKGDLSSSDFESAGGHFNPTGAEHGFNNPKGPHAGDLENIPVAEDGTVTYQTVNDRITLSEGPNSVLDEDGSALIIHEMTDDNRTDDDPETGPGTSGARAVAGVIEARGSDQYAQSNQYDQYEQPVQTLPDTGGIGPLSHLGPLASITLAALLVSAGASLFVLLRFRRVH